MRALLLAILMVTGTAARADDVELRKQIVGLWTLVSVVYEDQETKARTPVLGEHPRGRQLATADGRWPRCHGPAAQRAGGREPGDVADLGDEHRGQDPARCI